MPWRHMGSGVIAPSFFTSALDGGEWSASRPGHFTTGEIAPGIHLKGGWVCRREKSLPCRESNPGRPGHSPSLYRLSYHGSYVAKESIYSPSAITVHLQPPFSLNVKLLNIPVILKRVQSVFYETADQNKLSIFFCLSFRPFIFVSAVQTTFNIAFYIFSVLGVIM
jgi:hypothetical protein